MLDGINAHGCPRRGGFDVEHGHQLGDHFKVHGRADEDQRVELRFWADHQMSHGDEDVRLDHSSAVFFKTGHAQAPDLPLQRRGLRQIADAFNENRLEGFSQVVGIGVTQHEDAWFNPTGGHIGIDASHENFHQRHRLFLAGHDNRVGSFVHADSDLIEQRGPDGAFGQAFQIGAGYAAKLLTLVK